MSLIFAKDWDLSSFTPPTRAEWDQAIIKALRSRDPKELIQDIEPGLHIDPLEYPLDRITSTAEIPAYRAGFLIAESVMCEAVATGTAAVMNALALGAQAIHLLLPDARTPMDLAEIIKDVDLRWIQLQVVIQSTRYPKSDWIEVLGDALPMPFTGRLGLFYPDDSEGVSTWLSYSIQLPDSGHDYSARILAALYYLDRRAVDEVALRQIQLQVGIGANFLFELGYLRALKLCILNWMEVKAYAMDALPEIVGIVSTKAWRPDDVDYNKIMASTQGLSAVVGGVDQLIIPASDGDATGMGNRISRSLQHLYQLESHADQVVDTAAGSYYIEQVTNLLAHKAWTRFIENKD